MAWSLFGQRAVSPKSWADAVLRAGHDPVTTANEQSLIAQALLEGGGGTFNPLNTEQPEPGSTFFNHTDPAHGVQSYPDWQEGVKATVATIDGFSGMAAGLRSGQGYAADSADLYAWSGHGYSSLTPTWSKAASYLGGKSAPLPKGSGPPSSPGPGGSLPSSLGGLAIVAVLVIAAAAAMVLGAAHAAKARKEPQP